MTRRVRAALFDATGTLFEAREPIGETYRRFAAQQSAEISAWRLENAFQRVLGSAPPLCFPDAAPGEVPVLERLWWRDVVRQTLLAADSARRVRDFDACFAALYAHYGRGSAWQLRSHVRACLAALRSQDLRLGVLSNFDMRLPRILEDLEIAHYFTSVTIPATCRQRKPDAAAFRAALDSLGSSPAETIFVGDHPELDLAAARAIGLLAFDASEPAALRELPARIRHPATLQAPVPLEDPA